MSIRNFNTSNVTIQLIEAFAMALVPNISIHLMLLFNFRNICIIAALYKISIHLMLLFN